MEKPSRTQKKKRAQALQDLGGRLVALTAEQIEALELDPELKEAVVMAQQMSKHEARRRQLQYIGRLMREIDPVLVEQALDGIRSQKEKEKRKFKLIEQWRDDLVKGKTDRLSLLISQHPEVNSQQLNRLVHQARAAKSTPKARQASRQLFRFLMQSVSL